MAIINRLNRVVVVNLYTVVYIIEMKKIQVCVMNRGGPSASCGAKGSVQILHQLRSVVHEQGLLCEVEAINCLLYCQQGPNVRLLPDGKIWHKVDDKVCEEILLQVQKLHPR